MKPAHRLETRHQHVLQFEEMLDVGGGVGPLVGIQRATCPVGEPVTFGEPHVEEALHQRREGRCAHADESGRDLRVEQPCRQSSARSGEDRQVLFGGVRDHDARPSQNLGEGRDVDGERVDERDTGRPGHLHEGQARPVGTFAVEFGVERVARLGPKLADQVCERGAAVDPTRFHRPSMARFGHLGAVRPPFAVQARAQMCATEARTGPSRSNEASTSSWSSDRWRMITSVQPSVASWANAAATSSGPPTTGAAGSKPR